MEERIRELEERVTRAEEVLKLLGACVNVSREQGIAVTAPFRVVDADGRTMVMVEPGAHGAALRLLTPDGGAALVLDVIPTGGSIGVYHHRGRAVGLLFADEAGGDMALYDLDGNPQ